MSNQTPLRSALEKMRKSVASFPNTRLESLISCADVEARVEQARQQELSNMIAMAATPSACPFPKQDVLDRIKELTNLGN